LVSSVNRSLEKLGPQYHILEVKQKEPSTIVLISQVEQLIEYKNEESINQYTRKEIVTPTQSVYVLEEVKKRIFKHSKVVAKNERSIEKRKAKKNHAKVGWKKNVKNPFIIKRWIAGHLVRIQIDSRSDLDCILERFVKRYNLPTIRHLDPIRIKRFNREITRVVEK
jgi:hypothetical protein